MSVTDGEKKKTPDRRVLKTKRAIHHAFAELLSEKELENITVKDIADRADINRKTFYNYYTGIFQVIDEIENEIVDTFITPLKNIDFSTAVKQPHLILDRLTEVLNSDLDFYGNLFRAERNFLLASKARKALLDVVNEHIACGMDVDENMLNAVIEYTLSGMFGAYKYWFDSDRSQSLDDISKLISNLCLRGVYSVAEEAGVVK